ncbi:YciI family protein [Cochlodiniinecator piscidefendens]|uniref:YciI family protein n=1 Tax=Cochlodiniinecator piscidefendens TaxID=2715756 RepID=UPI00197C1D3F|nr:YciI family protein [Cochlodiniinecator piscidefendens]
MSHIPPNQNLFIVDLHYIASFDEIDPLIDAHVEFLEQHYASGNFITSGPKEPRTGGVIVATAATRAELESMLELDPFKMHNVANYTITEFRPSMKATFLEK